jgi:VWFA-related protein
VVCGAAAQSVAQQPAPNANAPDLSSQDAPASFKAKVNVVLVPVVVRDNKGRPVGDLHREDFLLFDRGKPQVIASFTVERSGTAAAGASTDAAAKAVDKEPGAFVAPDRFVAYLFDDVHLNFADLARARDAAGRHLDTSFEPGGRAAIFTTSGQTMLDFTDDRAKLHETLLRLRPRSVARAEMRECPDISYYMADLIVNKNDTQALDAATQETMICENMPADQIAAARQSAQIAAMRVMSAGEHETRIALGVLKDVIRRISVMPGRRTVVVVSPGFLTPENQQEKTEIMDRATRANVIINALDARGLYTVGVDASEETPPTGPSVMATLMQYKSMSASAEGDVLEEMADGTGGTFFHNSNDLDAGFKRVAARPEYYYVLGFSPQNLKLDGRYHALKVTLKEPAKLALQARRGYYAPTHLEDAAEEAKREIEEALFSREEMHELPVELHTQFFKTSDTDAKLAVMAHVDLKQMKFVKIDGRNGNVLRVVSGLFDRDGKYISATEKIITMRIRDETLVARQASGITVKTSFDVKSGSYVIRLVARDAEGHMMSAENGSVEIP